MTEKTIEKKLKELDELTAVALTDVKSEYLRGLANGLILAQSIFKDIEPAYITEKTGAR